jgi:hypothetical protein
MSMLRNSVTQLRKLAPSLHDTSDKAARIVLEIEDLLTRELGIDIEAEVSVGDGFVQLAYCRISGKYRIAVKRFEPGEKDEYTWEEMERVSWAEAPRHLKLESFPRLPRLLEEIVRKVERMSQEVEKTQVTLREFIGEDRDKAATPGGTSVVTKKYEGKSGSVHGSGQHPGGRPYDYQRIGGP